MTLPHLKPGSSPHTGELLDGRYLLETQVGVGGMGVVYRARDEVLGRTVAVKIFRESADETARSGSETRLLAVLNHSSLVTLFDAQTAPDQPNYLVMEFVEGPTLRQRLTEGPLDPRTVALMARDLAEALHVVHHAGIVHRDIKPSNVLLRASHVPGQEFRAKLADFGIAYLVDSTRLTTPGTLVGTAAYLSPEQVRGAEPAPASDIYALGLVLLESLTGQRAFPQTATHEAALARLTADPVIPAELGYPWKSLLTAMTARDPEERPTALDVVVRAAGVVAPEFSSGAVEAAATAPMEALSASSDSAPMAEAPSPAATSEMTEAPSPTATVVMPAEGAAAASTSVADMPAESVPTSTSDTVLLAEQEDESPRRRWVAIGVVVALIVVAVIALAIVWAVATSSSVPEPSLPPLDEPLGTHLHDLLDSVTR